MAVHHGWSAPRDESQADRYACRMSVHWQDAATHAVHHDALGGLDTYAGERRQVLLHSMVVSVG